MEGILIVNKVAEEITKDIVATVKLQLNYLCCFSENLKSMADEGERLKAKKQGLESQLAPRERNMEIRDPQVAKWLTDAENILKKKENEIDAKIPDAQSCWINMKSRFSLGKKVRETTEAMEKLRNQELPAIIANPENPARRIIPVGDIFVLQSRKKIEDDIIHEILSEENVVNIMGIAGMGGSGKTTLAKCILNRLNTYNSFETVDVVVSQQPVNILQIQQDIGEQLGLKDVKEWRTVQYGARELHSRLLKGSQKIIILLDDIWKEMELKDLGIPCEGGCVTVLTSRDKEIMKQMCHKVFEMKTLAPEEADSLFEEKVGSFCMKDLNLGSLGKEIADECGGLPLAVVTIASGLKNKDKQVWQDALSELKSCEVNGKVYKSLSLSYNLLHDNRNAQMLFLLCCLFPEDSYISLEDLVYCSMGLKMFDWDSLVVARRKVRGEVRKLKNRSLLLDGRDENEVKMHDVIRDVAISIALKEGLIDASLRSKGQDDKNYCKWISVYTLSSNETPNHLIGSNFLDLQLLIIHHIARSRGGLKINDISILKGMDGLSTLFFRNVEFRSPPERIEWLNSLSTLQFQWCNLKTLSFVGDLLNLKILDCNRCELIEELPIQIGWLKCLKLLNLHGCRKLERIAPGIISQLDELEELKMLKSFNGWESSKGDNKGKIMNVSLKELEALHKLTCLEIDIEDIALVNEEVHLSPTIVKYKILIGRGTDVFRENLKNVEKKLRLNGFPIKINNGSWIYKPPIGTKIEWLQMEKNGSDFWGNLSDTSNLKYLQISRSKKLKEVIGASTISHGYPKLEYLELYYLSDLTKICDGPIPGGSKSDTFRSLHTIEIYRCGNLRNLFLLERATDIFSQLKTLEIKDCEPLEEVFISSEKIENGKMERSCKTFPKLIELKLDNLPSLTSFWKGLESIEFPSLKNLVIVGCTKLKSLVCSTMESEYHCANDGKAFHLSCTSKVKFGTLKTLLIQKCNNLTAIFSSAIVDNISCLNAVCVEDCDKIERIIRMEKDNENEKIHHITFSQLKELRLSRLRNLTSLGEEMDNMEFPLLRNFVIMECPKLMLSNEEGDGQCNQMVRFGGFGKPDIVGCDIVSNIWCHKNMPLCSFKTVETLKIYGCNNMRTLFSSSVVENLANLRELKIIRCDRMEDVLRMDEQTSPIITFPKLTTLSLESLDSLKSFGKGIESIELPMLKEFSIIGCPTLRRLISHIIEGEGHDRNGTSFSLFCNQKIKCRRLEILTIVYCNAISSLCSSSMAENFLSCQRLEILSCHRIKKVITDENGKDMNAVVFPSLKTLTIHNLSLLEMFCECALELPLLETANIRVCPQMKFLTLAPLSTPKLHTLLIDRREFHQADLIEMEDLNTFRHNVLWPEEGYVSLSFLF